MFNFVSNTKITRRPTRTDKNRKGVIEMDFIHEYHWESNWKNFTDKGEIVFPKNLFYLDEFNNMNPLNGTKVNIGGYGSDPLILRGDRVEMTAGYTYYSKPLGKWVVEMADPKIIIGYVSKVYSGIPVRIEVMDNMWLLMQTPMPNRTFSGSDTLESILKLIIDTCNSIHGTTLTYNSLAKTTFGALITNHETAAQLLARIKKLYGISSFFRGNELRSGVITNFPSDVLTHVFIMNGPDGNVCAEGQQLEYQRRDDIVLSAIAYNTITENASGTTHDGKQKTKKTRLEVLVQIKNDVESINVISKGERVPDNEEGERRTFFFPHETTTDGLAKAALEQLRRYYYTGLKGSFKTFGIPYVRVGDTVELRNPKQPEQDGFYKTKSVDYYGGVNDGAKQQITLDYKVNI